MSERLRLSKGNLLLLGGTSSLGPSILDEARQRGLNTTSTFRSKHSQFDESLSNEWIRLDLSDLSSIRDFEVKIENRKFDIIICLIGKTFLSDTLQPNLQQIRDYFDSYITNLSYVLKNLSTNSLRKNNDSSLIYVSSRAVRGSYDMYYSAAKSAIESFIRSIGIKSIGSMHTYIVNCGLIVDSEMYFQMSESNRVKHRVMAKKPLVTISQFAQILFQELEEREKRTGVIDLDIGPRY